MPAVFEGVSYSLSPSLPPTRRDQLVAVLDVNGAEKHPPYTHLIVPAASHAHNSATNDPSLKLVTDHWVDRSIIMGKRQPEQYYSPEPAMIFSGVVACATDLSAADLEVLSAGVTALGGQWRAGLTRDVTHLFALRTGSDKYNTALHFAPQTHMCILTPHWFDDSVRLGRRIPEIPYLWPDPPVLRPGTMTLDLDDDPLATEGRRRRKPAAGTDGQAGDGSNVGEHVHVWAGRRILLSISLELTDGSRRAIEARVQRAGGVIVPVPEDADEAVEEKTVDQADVFVTRWRSGNSYFKAARASLIIGTLTWLFSVESSGTLHSPFDSLLWYPTPRGGIPDLIDCEISVTNYTGAARDYLKRLITLVGAKFTPSLSQSNKVLIAGFQPSPKTTRALSWSIPVVNHTWLEDCVVEWRALTVGLERYIVYPVGVDFGKILLTRHDGPAPSSQSGSTQRGGAVPGGRGIGTIDLDQEERRDAEYRARARGASDLSALHEVFENATTADGMSMTEGDILTELRAPPRSRAESVKKTPSSARGKRGSPVTVSAMGAFVDHVIALPTDDDNGVDGKRQTLEKGKQRARSTSIGSRAIASRTSSVGLFSAAKEAEVNLCNSGGMSKDGNEKNNKRRSAKQRTRPTENAEEDEDIFQPASIPKPKPGFARSTSIHSDNEIEEEGPSGARQATKMTISSDLDSHSDSGEGSEARARPRRPINAGSMTPVKSGMKPRPRSKSLSKPKSMQARESEEEVRAVAGESGISTETGRQREESAELASANSVVAKANEKEKTGERKEIKTVRRPRSQTRSPSPTSAGTKGSHTPKRRLSVVVPSVPKEYFSSQGVTETEGQGDRDDEVRTKKADTVISRTKRKQLMAATSIHVTAAEASTSTSKRGKPSPAKSSTATTTSGKSNKLQSQARVISKPGVPKAVIKARADHNGDSDEEDINAVSVIVDVPMTSTGRGGPRRSAANKATTRLREEVMPDVVNFEKEQKQAKRRRSVGGESVASVREGEGGRDERVGKKRKVASEEEEDEEAEVEDVVLVSSNTVKSKQISGKRQGKGRATVYSDEDINNPPTKNRPNGSQGTRGRGKELPGVRLMTTGVALLDDVIKRLTKLGVQMTTKPTDCTHLIAKGIVRTEKFLCAMSVSPYILTEDWANASAKGGKLLPEGDYLLSDPAAEQKWAFKFVDAMSRAKGREGGVNLFKQMTFYVTPKVSVDTKLLKNVVSAGGGQVQTSTTPTVRILKGKASRLVISCQEDKAIWRPLVQEGFKVYSPELVLRGALRQEIEWEREDCLVAG